VSFSKAGVKRELLNTVKAEARILWSHHEETRELPGERDNARNSARCTQARKTAGLPVEESLRMLEDRDK